VKIAVVAQRYGQAINGGAELHARYIAEHLARHTTVEVLTTCATDYVTWRNELPEGFEHINGVMVRRFHVRHERDPLAFARQSAQVFEGRHSVADELRWLEAEGPTSPQLVKHIARQANTFDYLIFFSYRYYQAFHGVRAASDRAILVPTAERDSAIGLSIFGPVFRGVRALMYNSPEERGMIQAVANNAHVPSVVVGIGSDVPANPQPARFRQKYNIRDPFAVYVGRIDENKGCKELFEFFQTYLQDAAGRLSLVLIGNSLLPIPTHPRIRYLGFLDEGDKFDGMAAAELLIMPSYFESLSMVALEAWALGRPVLVNGRCDVLKGQSIRSNAGLYYDTRLEFVETLRAIEQNRWLSGSLGKNGRQFFRDHYDWPVIERKYLDILQRLSAESAASAIEPLPGWFDRRKQECPAGSEVVAGLPSGPHLRMEPSSAPRPGRVAPPRSEGTLEEPEEPPPPTRGRVPLQRSRPGRSRARGGSALTGRDGSR
jgi:glycosyltransferase involved in cell wall biosynthesis